MRTPVSPSNTPHVRFVSSFYFSCLLESSTGRTGERGTEEEGGEGGAEREGGVGDVPARKGAGEEMLCHSPPSRPRGAPSLAAAGDWG